MFASTQCSCPKTFFESSALRATVWALCINSALISHFHGGIQPASLEWQNHTTNLRYSLMALETPPFLHVVPFKPPFIGRKMNLFDWLVCKQSIPMNGEWLNNPNYSSNFYPVVGKTQNSSRIWGWLFMKLDESENAACRSSMVKSWGPLVNSQIAGLAGYE